MEYKFLTFPARPRKKPSLPSSSRRPPLAVLLLQNYDAGNNFSSSSSSSSFPRGKGRRNQSTFLSCPERLFLPKRETKKRGEKKFSLFCVEEDQRLAVPRGKEGDSGASDPTAPYKKSSGPFFPIQKQTHPKKWGEEEGPTPLPDPQSHPLLFSAKGQRPPHKPTVEKD